MLIGILKRRDSILIQLFMIGLLLRASQSNSASFEVYYLRVDLLNEVGIFALTRASLLNLTRFWMFCIKSTTFV